MQIENVEEKELLRVEGTFLFLELEEQFPFLKLKRLPPPPPGVSRLTHGVQYIEYISYTKIHFGTSEIRAVFYSKIHK